MKFYPRYFPWDFIAPVRGISSGDIPGGTVFVRTQCPHPFWLEVAVTEIPDRQPARHLASCTCFLLCLAQVVCSIKNKALFLSLSL